MGLETLPDRALALAEDLAQAIALGLQHLEELPAPGEQGLELLGLGIREGTDRGPDPLREEREDVGIDPIGLRELARRLARSPAPGAD